MSVMLTAGKQAQRHAVGLCRLMKLARTLRRYAVEADEPEASAAPATAALPAAEAGSTSTGDGAAAGETAGAPEKEGDSDGFEDISGEVRGCQET